MNITTAQGKSNVKHMELLNPINGLTRLRFHYKVEGESCTFDQIDFDHIPTLDEVKAWYISNLILPFDNSPEVNRCYIRSGEILLPYWMNTGLRNIMKRAVADWKNAGNQVYILDIREYNASFPIDSDKLVSYIEQLEVYAIQCYNQTSKHIIEVNKLDNIDAVLSYDYKSGYPEKLTFVL